MDTLINNYSFSLFNSGETGFRATDLLSTSFINEGKNGKPDEKTKEDDSFNKLVMQFVEKAMNSAEAFKDDSENAEEEEDNFSKWGQSKMYKNFINKHLAEQIASSLSPNT